jgi:hypothetical protein
MSSFNNDVFSKNTKNISEVNGRAIKVHKDTKTECAGYTNYPFDIKNAISINKEIENENGYVKAVHKKVTKVFFSHEKPLVNELGNMEIQEVDPDALDNELLDDLENGAEIS